MRKTKAVLAGLALSLMTGSYVAYAAPAPALEPVVRDAGGPMSFFVTSVGLGKGGDLGGLAGADAHCQTLATAAGSTKTWRAYLSTQARPGQPAINARDRIGKGPWHNSKQVIMAADLNILHGDTLEAAQQGNSMWKLSILNEKKQMTPGEGDPGNRHDVLTGSTTDGRAFTDAADHTCNNWTSSGPGSVRVGHTDRVGGGNSSWNSSEEVQGCSQEAFEKHGGAGLLYCFAVN